MLDEPSLGLAPLVVREIFRTIVAAARDRRVDPAGRAERARRAGGGRLRLRAGDRRARARRPGRRSGRGSARDRHLPRRRAQEAAPERVAAASPAPGARAADAAGRRATRQARRLPPDAPGRLCSLRAPPSSCARCSLSTWAARPDGVEFSILDARGSNRQVNQKQLGQALDISPPNMAVTLDRHGRARLGRAGAQHPRPARQQSTSPRRAGRCRAARREIAATMEEPALRALSPAERALLIELLRKIVPGSSAGAERRTPSVARRPADVGQQRDAGSEGRVGHRPCRRTGLSNFDERPPHESTLRRSLLSVSIATIASVGLLAGCDQKTTTRLPTARARPPRRSPTPHRTTAEVKSEAKEMTNDAKAPPTRPATSSTTAPSPPR